MLYNLWYTPHEHICPVHEPEGSLLGPDAKQPKGDQ